MPRPLKSSILGAHTIILAKNIHKVTKTLTLHPVQILGLLLCMILLIDLLTYP